MKKLFFLLSFSFLILNGTTLKAQQDCYIAKKVLCADTYFEATVFNGAGNNENEISPQTPANAGGNSCIPNYEADPTKPPIGESNSVWYTFIPQIDGQLLFEINPTVASADFDWIIYNLSTNRTCDQIFSNHTNFIAKSTTNADACNAASGGGSTGAVVGPADLRHTDPIIVTQGDRYVMCVNRAPASVSSTFTIDFSATDPAIFDNVAPKSATAAIVDVICTTTKIDLTFDEDVDCSNTALNPDDFEIRDASGTTKVTGMNVASLTVPACQANPPAPGGKAITLNITGNFPSAGQYSVVVVAGTADGNTIKDLCPSNFVAPNTIIAPIEVVCANFSAAFPNCSLEGTFTDLSGITNGNFTYLYDFNDAGNTSTNASPVHSFSAPGTYNVKQTITKTSSSETSQKTVPITITIDNSCAEMNFPSAYNPLGKEKEFKVYPRGLVKDFSIKIFDRWGKMVYASTDASKNWDGKLNGTLINAGVYAIISSYSFQADNGAKKYEYNGLLSVTY